MISNLKSQIESLKAQVEEAQKQAEDARREQQEQAQRIKDAPPPAPAPSEPSGPSQEAYDQLKKELDEAKTKQVESEKEQEDLLVMLDEISGKRKTDKKRMREAKMDVSEDEDDDDDDDEE